MDSEVIISLLNELKNLLYSKPNLKLISEQAIILYQDLKLFSFDLKHPIKDFPERACIDKISVKLLPVDFNNLLPAQITGDGNCLMNSISYIFTETEKYSTHFRFAVLLEMIINYDFYLSKNF
jgi:hypothetical protein